MIREMGGQMEFDVIRLVGELTVQLKAASYQVEALKVRIQELENNCPCPAENSKAEYDGE